MPLKKVGNADLSSPDIPGVVSSPNQRHEAVKALHETYHHLYWESSNSLLKTWGFYLIMTGALIGYVLTKGMSPTLSKSALMGAVVISATMISTFAGWTWGLHGIVRLLERLTKELDHNVFYDFGLNRIFSHWRRLVLFIMVCTIVDGALIIAGIVLLAIA